MAEIVGILRDDATFGEKAVRKALRYNLPRDFTVYVECPLETRRMQRFPDFIVVANYGAVVLEVKDWVQIVRADPHHVTIRRRNGEEATFKNPVLTARDYAHALQENLREVPELLNERHQLEVPWGYAAVFPNLGVSVSSQLRQVLGKTNVIGQKDLGPDIIMRRLRETLPEGFAATLKGDQLRHIRATIFPAVLIEQPDQPAIILDEVQEKIVAEPLKEEIAPLAEEPAETQLGLMQEEEPATPPEETPPEEAALVSKLSVRLVRGIAGSGKSLVLIQRAKFLASQFPEWNILVVTYNRKLAERLASDLQAFRNIHTTNFHRLGRNVIRSYMNWNLNDSLRGWIKNHKENFKIIDQVGAKFIEEEIKWIKENGLDEEADYLSVIRRGRGTDTRITREQRSQVFSVLDAYRNFQDENGTFDWQDVPWLMIDGLRSGQASCAQYDAILIDEAQDFAPCWVQALKEMVKTDTGSIFIADDPTQSIYRYYSWKEKGVQVVGRTRWLRIPYRNTKQIYNAAFAIIQSNKQIREQLKAEGELLNPDVDNPWMRSGEKPLVSRVDDYSMLAQAVADRVNGLVQEGVPPTQIAVLAARKNQISILRNKIMDNDVTVDTFYQFKGMEFRYVFLANIQDLFHDEDEDTTARMLRLMYMGMTRAREYLFIYYRHHFPRALNALREHCDFIQ